MTEAQLRTLAIKLDLFGAAIEGEVSRTELELFREASKAVREEIRKNNESMSDNAHRQAENFIAGCWNSSISVGNCLI